MDSDIDARIAENDRQRFALDREITAMRAKLSALNKISKALAVEKRAAVASGKGGVNASVAGAVLTGSTKKR